MNSDIVTNQISLLNSHPNPVHRKYERFFCTIRIGLKYLSTSYGYAGLFRVQGVTGQKRVKSI